ncbi:MAG TPA: hypothetical protein VGY97_01040 [Solirubrobacteraceae bacterium]|nr:hypothetical protein [Solirubrobacteraceae bacterium]
MGRRSRKRGLTGTIDAPADPPRPAPAARPVAPSDRRRPRREEAPPAPWAPFPLVELCILAGIVLMVVGAVEGGSRGHLILALGVALISLSALELSIREHFSGYRSHTSLLALACTVAIETLAFFVAGPAPIVMVAIAVVAFGTAWTLFREAFRRRAGGLSWRA